MTWTTIADADLDPGEPWTSLKALALRDNFPAMAAGDTGAPKIIGKAMDLWLADFTVTGTTAAGVSDLDGYDAIRIEYSEGNGSGATLQARFSDDNGSTWGSFQNITTGFTGNVGYSGVLLISLVSGAFTIIGAVNYLSASTTVPGNPYATGTLTVPSGANAFQLRYATTGRTLNARAFGWGTID